MPRRRTRIPRATLRRLTPRRPKGLPDLTELKSLAPTWPLRAPALPRRRRGPAEGGRWLPDQRTTGLGGRSYEVYLPAGLRRRTRAPMLVLLHGCTQSPQEFAEATRFTSVADRHGVILVVPRQEKRHHSQRCWRWYESRHQRRGRGEPAMLAAITRQVAAEETRWRVDPLRIYVAGLSAGGAMALIMATAYPDLFAAAGVHSAPPYRAATGGLQALSAMAARTAVPPPQADAPAMAPLLVVQGTDDEVVAAPNGERVVEQWLAHRAAAAAGNPALAAVGRSRTERSTTADGRHYTRVRWYSRRQRVLEYWLVQRLGHAWSGGRAGAAHSDPAGPRAATLMWTFFAGHRLDRSGTTDVDRVAG